MPSATKRRTWSAVLDRARAELPETTFLMWFTDVRPTRLEDEVLSLAVPSQFVRERLQHNHLGLIATTATEVYGRPVKIHMEVDEAIRHEEAPGFDLAAPIDRTTAPAAFAAIGAPPAQAPTPAPRTLRRCFATLASLFRAAGPHPARARSARKTGPSVRVGP